MTALVKSPIQIYHPNMARVPWNKGTKGLVLPNSGSFKKGQEGWNKGKTGLFHNPLKGQKMSEEWKAKLRKPKSVTHKKSPEQIAQMSARAKLRVGVLSSRWKGGIGQRKAQIRRERMAANGGFHTFGEWETLKVQYNFTCPCCLRVEPGIKLTEDHIIPVSKGGSNNIENIQPLCGHCNVKKHNKVVKYIYG